MASQEKDNQAKARIISHMNADHQDSLIRFLEHFHKLSSRAAYPARMSSIDLAGLNITCNAKSYRIHLTPNLTSYSEARERLAELDRICKLYLKREAVTITEFKTPLSDPVSLVGFVVCLATFVGFSQRWWWEKGEVVERYAGAAFAEFGWKIQPYLIAGMVGIHGLEMLWFVRNKLRGHSVNSKTWAWWLWAGTSFVEGQFAIKRFERLVKKKEGEKAKKH